LLSVITNSEIREIIRWKYEELKELKMNLKNEIKRFRWDDRKLLELLFEDGQKEIERVIKRLQFELKQRDTMTWFDNSLNIEQLKAKISIVDLISYLIWRPLDNTRRLYSCFLPDHQDNTPSFKIYDNTNSWYCFGCHRGWDVINFIEHYFNVDTKDAILKLKKFVYED
jgi:hypothetical protein